jgi:hypothetical protein
MLLLLPCLSLARPNGSPLCSLNYDRMLKSPHSSEYKALKHYLQLKKVGTAIEFAINHPTNEPYQGLLLYVTGPLTANHLGSFLSLPQGFKFMAEGVCKAQGVLGDPSSTLTHSISGDKDFSSKFLWNYNGTVSRLTVNAIVIDSRVAPYPRWKFLKVSFNSTQSGSFQKDCPLYFTFLIASIQMIV